MSRGKYAARAERRADSAKDEHIHRLTDWLADAKMRARQCERDAAKVPELKRRIAELEAKIDNDTVLQDILERAQAHIDEYTKLWKWAMGARDAFLGIAVDWQKHHPLGSSPIEWTEFISRRWPECFDNPKEIYDGGVTAKGLSDEAIKRIQHIRGLRHADIDGKDVAAWLLEHREKEAELTS